MDRSLHKERQQLFGRTGLPGVSLTAAGDRQAMPITGVVIKAARQCGCHSADRIFDRLSKNNVKCHRGEYPRGASLCRGLGDSSKPSTRHPDATKLPTGRGHIPLCEVLSDMCSSLICCFSDDALQAIADFEADSSATVVSATLKFLFV